MSKPIVIEPAHANVGPSSFYVFAEHYLKAASALLSNPDFSPVSYYLIGHSLELSLKSLLSSKGYKRKLLKDKFGHDLIKILKEVKSCGLLQLSKAEEKLISGLNVTYGEKSLEYYSVDRALIENWKSLPPLKELYDLATKITAEADKLWRQEFIKTNGSYGT